MTPTARLEEFDGAKSLRKASSARIKSKASKSPRAGQTHGKKRPQKAKRPSGKIDGGRSRSLLDAVTRQLTRAVERSRDLLDAPTVRRIAVRAVSRATASPLTIAAAAAVVTAGVAAVLLRGRIPSLLGSRTAV